MVVPRGVRPACAGIRHASSRDTARWHLPREHDADLSRRPWHEFQRPAWARCRTSDARGSAISVSRRAYVVGLALGLALFALAGGARIPPVAAHGDFAEQWAAARVVLEGGDPYQTA